MGWQVNARRYPRTLQEAFGPYTSNDISEPDEPWCVPDLAIAAVAVLAAVLITLGVI